MKNGRRRSRMRTDGRKTRLASTRKIHRSTDSTAFGTTAAAEVTRLHDNRLRPAACSREPRAHSNCKCLRARRVYRAHRGAGGDRGVTQRSQHNEYRRPEYGRCILNTFLKRRRDRVRVRMSRRSRYSTFRKYLVYAANRCFSACAVQLQKFKLNE